MADPHHRAVSSTKKHRRQRGEEFGEHSFDLEAEWTVLKDAWARSRLVYPNPVCFLTTARDDGAASGLNAMVVTWLTASDNLGSVVMSVNEKRFSAGALERAEEAAFTLSVAARGAEALLLRVGTCSGFDVDKFAAVEGLEPRTVPFRRFPAAVNHGSVVAVMCCTVERIDRCIGKADHLLVMAKIAHAIVRRSHWNGKCFGDRAMPLLSFLGSKRFAVVIPDDSEEHELDDEMQGTLAPVEQPSII